MTFSQDDHAAVAARIDALMPWQLAWGSTVAFLVVRGRSLHVFGSGTLLRIADESLLVTATHVIEEAKAKDMHIILADKQNKTDLIPLVADGILGDRDGLDVAVLQLRSQVVERIEDNAFLRLDSVSYEPNLSDAMFTVLGFPAIMACHESGRISITKYHHIAPAYEGSTSALDRYNERVHFLVAADLSEAMTMDGKPVEFRYRSGEPAPFPKELGGISGGSVWLLATNPDDARKRLPGSARMIGVDTGVYPTSKCIKASRWSVVVGMLRDALPELRRSIDMWRGD